MQKAPYFCALEKRKCVSDKTPLRFLNGFWGIKKQEKHPEMYLLFRY